MKSSRDSFPSNSRRNFLITLIEGKGREVGGIGRLISNLLIRMDAEKRVGKMAVIGIFNTVVVNFDMEILNFVRRSPFSPTKCFDLVQISQFISNFH